MKTSQKGASVALAAPGDRPVPDTRERLSGPSGGKKKSGLQQRFQGGYRPGMYGGYRPWYAERTAGGAQGDWKLGALLKLPGEVRQAARGLFTGGLIGVVGDRVLAWVAPGILKTQNRIAVEGVAFGVTLLPYVFKPNTWTMGMALPGLFAFMGALTEAALGATGILGPKPVLSGGQPQANHAAAVAAARQKLAEANARMAGARISPPRVQATRVA
jgi:hypothetical protein